MSSVSFNARERRLVVEGPCWPGDQVGIAHAIEECAEPTHGLVVDLTRLATVPPEVAAAVEDACRTVERRGTWVRLWKPKGSDAPPALTM